MDRETVKLAIVSRVFGRIHKASNGEESENLKGSVSRDDVIQYFKKNPRSTDKKYHEWAEGKGVDPHKAEEAAYKVLGGLLKKEGKDAVPGGLAEGKNPSDFDQKALAEGTKVEMEHTTSKQIAQEIAMDHLVEDPKYYKKLKKMEKH